MIMQIIEDKMIFKIMMIRDQIKKEIINSFTFKWVKTWKNFKLKIIFLNKKTII